MSEHKPRVVVIDDWVWIHGDHYIRGGSRDGAEWLQSEYGGDVIFARITLRERKPRKDQMK